MPFSGGDPTVLRDVSHGLGQLATSAGEITRDLSAVTSSAGGAVGVPALAGAIERFAAAWGGEVLACGCATATLGSVADTSSEQLTAATGTG